MEEKGREDNRTQMLENPVCHAQNVGFLFMKLKSTEGVVLFLSCSVLFLVLVFVLVK